MTQTKLSARDAVSWTAPASVDAHAITALACPSTSLCVAVDNAGDVITTANPVTGPWVSTSVAGAAGFTGLSCPSTSLCVAVDQAGNVATSSDPSGGSGRWTLTNVSSDHPLSAVSCASVTLCAATVDAGAINSVAQADAAGTVLVSTTPQTSGSWLPDHADSNLGFECGKYGEWDSCYTPTGRFARIGALIRHRGYSLSFNPATAGRVRISWYAGRSCRPAAAKRRVKVANGSRGYSGTTSGRTRLTLTRGGRRLLKRSRRLQITAVASFSPSGAHVITASRTFTLRR